MLLWFVGSFYLFFKIRVIIALFHSLGVSPGVCMFF
jgi:hypothetical protein